MRSRDAQSLIFAGFVIAFSAMIVGLFLLTTKVADHGKILIAFGAIFLIGAGAVSGAALLLVASILKLIVHEHRASGAKAEE